MVTAGTQLGQRTMAHNMAPDHRSHGAVPPANPTGPGGQNDNESGSADAMGLAPDSPFGADDSSWPQTVTRAHIIGAVRHRHRSPVTGAGLAICTGPNSLPGLRVATPNDAPCRIGRGQRTAPTRSVATTECSICISDRPRLIRVGGAPNDGDALNLRIVHQLAGCDASMMDIVTLSDAPGYDRDRVVAQPFLEGSQCNVRIIRLSPGQVLPPHTHGSSGSRALRGRR
jgi:hypothetical protein